MAKKNSNIKPPAEKEYSYEYFKTHSAIEELMKSSREFNNKLKTRYDKGEINLDEANKLQSKYWNDIRSSSLYKKAQKLGIRPNKEVPIVFQPDNDPSNEILEIGGLTLNNPYIKPLKLNKVEPLDINMPSAKSNRSLQDAVEVPEPQQPQGRYAGMHLDINDIEKSSAGILRDAQGRSIGKPIPRTAWENVLEDGADLDVNTPIQKFQHGTQHVMPDNNKNIGSSDYLDLSNYFGASRGVNPKNFSLLLDQIAYHESGGKNIRQKSDKTKSGYGPGRGYYQFEPDSLKTAITRAKNIAKVRGVQAPAWLDTIADTGYNAMKLSKAQQDYLALADMSQRSNFDLKRASTDLTAVPEVWGKGWQTKNDPKKIATFKAKQDKYLKERGIESYLPYQESSPVEEVERVGDVYGEYNVKPGPMQFMFGAGKVMGAGGGGLAFADSDANTDLTAPQMTPLIGTGVGAQPGQPLNPKFRPMNFKIGCKSLKVPKYQYGGNSVLPLNPNSVASNPMLTNDNFLIDGNNQRGDISTAYVNNTNMGATNFNKVRKWQPTLDAEGNYTNLVPTVGQGGIGKNFSENEWHVEYKTNRKGETMQKLKPNEEAGQGGFIQKAVPLPLNAKFMKYGAKAIRTYNMGTQAVTGQAGGDMYVPVTQVSGGGETAGKVTGGAAAGGQVGSMFGPKGQAIGMAVGAGTGLYLDARQKENERRARAAQLASNKSVFENTYEDDPYRYQGLAGGMIAKYGMKNIKPNKYMAGGAVNPASVGGAIGGLASFAMGAGDEDEAPWLGAIATLAPMAGQMAAGMGGAGGGAAGGMGGDMAGAMQGAGGAGGAMAQPGSAMGQIDPMMMQNQVAPSAVTKFGTKELNPAQTYKVDGIDSAYVEIEAGEVVAKKDKKGKWQMLDVNPLKIDNLEDDGKGGFTTNSKLRKPVTAKSLNKDLAYGKKHSEANPITGKTGIHTILPIGASIISSKYAKEFAEGDDATREAIWSRTPSQEKSQEMYDKQMKAKYGMKKVPKYQTGVTGINVGNPDGTYGYTGDGVYGTDYRTALTTGGTLEGGSIQAYINKGIEEGKITPQSSAQDLQNYLGGREAEFGGAVTSYDPYLKELQAAGIDPNDPRFNNAFRYQDVGSMKGYGVDTLAQQFRGLERIDEAPTREIKMDSVERPTRELVGTVTPEQEADPTQPYTVTPTLNRGRNYAGYQAMQMLPSLYNLGMGTMGKVDRLQLGRYNPDLMQYRDLSERDRMAANQQSAIARSNMGKRYMSRGQGIGEASNIQQQYMQNIGRINQLENRRYDQIAAQNVGLKNQAQLYNIGAMDKETMYGKQAEGKKQQFLAKGLDQAGKFGAVSRREAYMKDKDALADYRQQQGLQIAAYKYGLTPEQVGSIFGNEPVTAQGLRRAERRGLISPTAEGEGYTRRDARRDMRAIERGEAPSTMEQVKQGVTNTVETAKDKLGITPTQDEFNFRKASSPLDIAAGPTSSKVGDYERFQKQQELDEIRAAQKTHKKAERLREKGTEFLEGLDEYERRDVMEQLRGEEDVNVPSEINQNFNKFLSPSLNPNSKETFDKTNPYATYDDMYTMDINPDFVDEQTERDQYNLLEAEVEERWDTRINELKEKVKASREGKRKLSPTEKASIEREKNVLKYKYKSGELSWGEYRKQLKDLT